MKNNCLIVPILSILLIGCSSLSKPTNIYYFQNHEPLPKSELDSIIRKAYSGDLESAEDLERYYGGVVTDPINDSYWTQYAAMLGSQSCKKYIKERTKSEGESWMLLKIIPRHPVSPK